MRSRLLIDAAWMALVGGAYFLAARLGLAVAFPGQLSAVRPPSGIALAALLACGSRVWPGIAIGALFAELSVHEPLSTAGAVACGSTLQAVGAAWLLKSVVDFDNALERFTDVLALLIVAAVCSTALGATVGVSSLCLGGAHSWADFATLWQVWWLGDALSDVVLAPLILASSAAWGRRWTSRMTAEGLLLVAVLALVSWNSFGSHVSRTDSQHAYPVFPVVIWAALRFRQLGATAATFLISAAAVIGALRGSGPFEEATVAERLSQLQMFLAVVATTGLLLAAATTERARAHKLLRDSDRRKDEFLAMLAHELRNPLAPISHVVQLLRSTGPGDRDYGELTAIIERQVRQMTRLVDDLLDISRITRGKLALRKETVELSEVIGRAVETSRPLIDAHSHELSINVPPEPVFLSADSIRLAQVVCNLLNNAAKFTPPGGRIELLAQGGSNCVVVAVRDNGIGIPPEAQSRIFEIFSQIDPSNQRTPGGVGIGLALARRLVEMHDGTIEVRSAGPGRGSEFRVTLPGIVPAIVRLEPESDTGREAPVRRRILIADDNEDSLATLSLLLSRVGNEVRQAHDGREAVELANAFRPDVALLDIGMPVMDGHEAARRIRNSPWGAAMVLIALTGLGQEEDRQRSAQAGFDYHLTKPVDLPALKDLLRTFNAEARTPASPRK